MEDWAGFLRTRWQVQPMTPPTTHFPAPQAQRGRGVHPGDCPGVVHEVLLHRELGLAGAGERG